MAIIAQNARSRIRWPQNQSVPRGGRYDAFMGDAAGGAIDYGSRINRRSIPAWPNHAPEKIGDGMGPDGSGLDGFGSGGVGDGRGADGLGMDGFGAKLLEHLTDEMPDGTYNFAVVGYDPAGNASTGNLDDEAVLAGTPEPPGGPTADSYVQGTDTVTFSWPLSDDDTG